MRKIIALTCAIFCVTGIAFAQEFQVSGEIKTGLYWEKSEIDGVIEESARIHNNDDAGTNMGRFRMNFFLQHENIGVKVRFEQLQWSGATYPNWAFAFAYGDFLSEQLRFTIGKLGESPWGAGGPEIWNELEAHVGARTEIKPAFLPGLNIGFAVTWYNNSVYNDSKTLGDLFADSTLGIAYTHEYFHGRFSYRLDSDADTYNTGASGSISEGTEMIYRLEERVLNNMINGLSIWANGYWKGIGAEDTSIIDYKNWIYFQYAPPAFTTQLRLGYDIGDRREEFHGRVSFFYNILPFLSAGTSFRYVQDFGEYQIVEGSPYYKLEVEPQLRLNVGNAIMAFVYFYGSEYTKNAATLETLIRSTHKINLRFMYTF